MIVDFVHDGTWSPKLITARTAAIHSPTCWYQPMGPFKLRLGYTISKRLFEYFSPIGTATYNLTLFDDMVIQVNEYKSQILEDVQKDVYNLFLWRTYDPIANTYGPDPMYTSTAHQQLLDKHMQW